MQRDVRFFRRSLTSGLQVGKLRHGEGKWRAAEGALGLRLGSIPCGRRFLRETPALASARRGFGAAAGVRKCSSRGPKGRGSAPTPPRADAQGRVRTSGCSHPSQLPTGTRPRWGSSGLRSWCSPGASGFIREARSLVQASVLQQRQKNPTCTHTCVHERKHVLR